ncbi:serine hydrolase [Sphingomonas deserti]|uniref:Serine hydrolase n=1 Tax=Allosphingosinicella deserti TaxID=2116704 RepID=A0A2P7QJ58_9SPHN|nr:serine hydrolase [Sphingomonas deserti]
MAEPATAASEDPLRARAEDVVRFLNGEAPAEEVFNAAFLREIPAAQIGALASQIRHSGGRALRVSAVAAAADHSGVVTVELERSILQLRLGIDAAHPNRIAGLLVEANAPRSDSMAAVLADIRALPGTVSFAVARLGEGAPALLSAHEPDRPLAIGSAFKLFILAELARGAKAGERRWSDVVPFDRRSLGSGILQDWPQGSPMTLHSLAALMISRSDNSASDVLLHRLGRERVEAVLPMLGLAAPGRNRPFLSTHEAFALKYGADRSLLLAYVAADEAGRRALLPRLAATPLATLDPMRTGGSPTGIGSAEWFASSADLVRTMDWLRRQGGDEALRILAIAPGADTATARRFPYFGYKGGSEPGVVNMTFLAKRRDNGWIVATASWNNEAAAVSTERLGALMTRALNLSAEGS